MARRRHDHAAGRRRPPDDDARPRDDTPEPASLDLDAPRTARTRAKAITVELTASGTGRVQLTLVRGERVVARASVKLAATAPPTPA